MTFEEKNRGKFAVWQAGILVHRAFNTYTEAEQWAQWNYKNRANWTIRPIGS